MNCSSENIVVVENVDLVKISCAIPRNKYRLTEYAPNLFDEKSAKRMAKVTGFSSLCIAPEEMTTSDLCCAAAEQLLDDIDREKIKGIIFVSQTADYTTPATSHVLQHKMGFSHNIICMDINEGCSGWVRGLYVAALLCENMQSAILLLTGDTLSKHTSPDDRATRGIFGDAGTATLIMPGKRRLPFMFKTYGEYKDDIKVGNYFQLRQKNHKNGLGNLYSYINGGAIMDFSLKEVPETIENFICMNELSKEDIKLYACHQANKLILNNLADKLGVTWELVPFTSGKIGNESSASIPLVLSQENGKRDLSSCLCVGFGVGMSIGLVHYDFSCTQFYPILEI